MVVVAVLLGAGVVAAIVVVGDEPGTPERWDPRIDELARFVELARDLDFEHPVAARFLTEEEFREEVAADEGGLTDEEREELETYQGVFRALGLVEGDFDILEATNTLLGEGTLAFYDPEADEMVIRGTDTTVGVRVTIVHELTHALQDQHFDLTRLDDEDLTSGEVAAFEALVEGDAVRIENEYINTLDDEELSAYDDESTSEFDMTEEAIADVPPILQAVFAAPYALGEGLLAVLDGEGGSDEIDDAFRNPPRSEEHLMDPWTFLDGDVPEEVPTPELDDGEEEIDTSDFGALSWFLVLAERIDPRVALVAVNGWGGDAMVAYEDDGRACVRIAFRGDDARDTDEMERAIEAWIAEIPPGVADARRSGAIVTLQSCDPGADAALTVEGRSTQLLTIPLTRTIVTFQAVSAGLPARDAACVSDAFLAALTVERILTLDEFLYSEEAPTDVSDALNGAFAECGAPLEDV